MMNELETLLLLIGTALGVEEADRGKLRDILDLWHGAKVRAQLTADYLEPMTDAVMDEAEKMSEMNTPEDKTAESAQALAAKEKRRICDRLRSFYQRCGAGSLRMIADTSGPGGVTENDLRDILDAKRVAISKYRLADRALDQLDVGGEAE